jgi:hypothetical protein
MKYNTSACCRYAIVFAFVFAGAISATQAQTSTPPGNEAPQSPRPSIVLQPGFLQTVDVHARFTAVHIGDDTLVGVEPISDTTFIVRGKQIGETNISLFANDHEVAVYNVLVYPLPHSQLVEVHDGKELQNSVTYECLANYGCGYPIVHEVVKQDLPKGYSIIDTTTHGGQGGQE